MGMFFANPWGLLGLLALPAIMIIHLYHRRFPPRVVAGLHLWGAESRVPVAGRKRERLPVSRSLIFELLAALLLTLVLAQPRFGDLDAVRHFIAVIDGSASMSAVGSDGFSASDRALSDLKTRLDAAPRGSRVTIVSTGRRPVLLAGPAVDWATAVDGVGDWQPTAPEHDVFPALDMASQLADGGGEVLYYSDRLPGDELPVPDQTTVIAVGESLGNLAITAARWTIHPPAADAPVTDANFGTVFLRIANSGARTVTAEVVGRAGDRDVILTMDADNSHVPGLIPSMVRVIAEGYDVVIASRYQAGARVVGLTARRRILSFGASLLFRGLFPIPNVRDYTCGFRAYRAELIRGVLEENPQFISERGFSCMVDILLKLRVREPSVTMAEVPLLLRYDKKKGASKMNVGATIGDTLRLVVRRRLGSDR